MDLRETILAGHSRANCDLVVQWIGNKQPRFDELVDLFLNDEPLLMQRAAWPLSEVTAAFPHLVKKHIGKILAQARKPGIHDAVKRNTVRLLQVIDIPVKFHAEVMNLCFDFITDPNEKPAVKAFSLTVLDHLSQQYPDIKQELKTIIEDRWEHESAAFRSRARKILR